MKLLHSLFAVLFLLSTLLLPIQLGAFSYVTEAAGCPPLNEQVLPYYPTPLAAAKYDKNGDLKIVDKNTKDADIQTGLQRCGAMGVVWDAKRYYEIYPLGGDQIDRIITYEQASYRSASPNTYYYRTVKYYFIFAGENVSYADPYNNKPVYDVEVPTYFGGNESVGADVGAFQAAASEEWDRLNNTNPYMYPDGTPKISYTLFTRRMILEENNQPITGYWVKGRNNVWSKIDDYGQILDQEADYLVIAPAIMIYRTTKASKTDGIEVLGWVRPDKFKIVFGPDGKPDVQKTAQSAKDYILGDGMPGIYPNGKHTKEEVAGIFNTTAGKDYHTLFRVIPLRDQPDYAISLAPVEREGKPGDTVTFQMKVTWEGNRLSRGFRVIMGYKTPAGQIPVSFTLNGNEASTTDKASYLNVLPGNTKGEMTTEIKLKVYDKPSTLIAQVRPIDEDKNVPTSWENREKNPKNNDVTATVKPIGVNYAAAKYHDSYHITMDYDEASKKVSVQPIFNRIDNLPTKVPYVATVSGPGGTVKKEGSNLAKGQMLTVPYSFTVYGPGTYKVQLQIWPVPKELETAPENNTSTITVIVERLPKPEPPPDEPKIHVELGG